LVSWRDGARPKVRRASTPKPIRPTLKRWEQEDLLKSVRLLIPEMNNIITAEEVAEKLQTRKDKIEICFKQLIQEKLMSRVVNRPPSDCGRGWGTGSAWTPSFYRTNHDHEK
jgi:hypothetical protein